MMVSGKTVNFADNVNTDVILPGKYLVLTDPVELAKHAMEGLDSDFIKKAKGAIIVAGRNFGCGSSRQHAPLALKHAGVQCVIAESFSRIFFRNAINQGLALVQSQDAYEQIKDGEIITVNYTSGEILTQDKKIPFPPLPEIVMGILKDGGLIEHLKKTLRK